MTLTCETCGQSFFQARGRPSKTCPEHRNSRYGPEHRQLRAQTVHQAVGKPCARCGEPIRAFDAVDLDHADDQSGDYLGYSHRRCNSSAGAARGNRLRAAAYRASQGLPEPTTPVVVHQAEPASAPCHRNPSQIDVSAVAGQPLPCICGGHSRCW